jgi:hypothetical protein
VRKTWKRLRVRMWISYLRNNNCKNNCKRLKVNSEDDTFSVICWKRRFVFYLYFPSELKNKQQFRLVFYLPLVLLLNDKQVQTFLPCSSSSSVTCQWILPLPSYRNNDVLLLSHHKVSHKDTVTNILTKDLSLRINLNLDGSPIVPKSQSHPSHSETSRLLTSSLSLSVPVPRSTQCMWGV